MAATTRQQSITLDQVQCKIDEATNRRDNLAEQIDSLRNDLSQIRTTIDLIADKRRAETDIATWTFVHAHLSELVQ